jgi:hypothetical protein
MVLADAVAAGEYCAVAMEAADSCVNVVQCTAAINGRHMKVAYIFQARFCKVVAACCDRAAVTAAASAGDDNDDEGAQKLSEFKAAFKQAPKGKKAAGKKSAAAAAAAAGKVDGVGTGALAAAKAAVGVDVDSTITWKKGQPVPYAFLAETFQVGP